MKIYQAYKWEVCCKILFYFLVPGIIISYGTPASLLFMISSTIYFIIAIFGKMYFQQSSFYSYYLFFWCPFLSI